MTENSISTKSSEAFCILSDNSKEITSSFDCNALNENIHLSKGFNKIAVNWDEDSNMIEVNRLI